VKGERHIVVGITGASGIIYAVRLLEELSAATSIQLSVILTPYAQQVAAVELGGPIPIPARAQLYDLHQMDAPFASGSNPPDAMVIIPCTMGTLARIAHGTSETLLLRAADVVLKERRKLILVPREAPLNRIHLQNMLALTDAGGVILPACPAFYHRPQTVKEVVDSVVGRVLDHLGLSNRLVSRWQESEP